MVMDRTTLGRAIRPLERDKLLAIGAGDDGRTRCLRLTATGAARLKEWRIFAKAHEVVLVSLLRNVVVAAKVPMQESH